MKKVCRYRQTNRRLRMQYKKAQSKTAQLCMANPLGIYMGWGKLIPRISLIRRKQ
jgi:hypothetical protein